MTGINILETSKFILDNFLQYFLSERQNILIRASDDVHIDYIVYEQILRPFIL